VNCSTVNDEAVADRIPGSVLREKLGEALESYVRFFQNVDVDPPYVVMLSLLGVARHCLLTSAGAPGQPMQRSDLLLPEVMIGDPDDVPDVMKRLLDVVCQSSGFSDSSVLS
jgi:hypothetical protein